MLYDQPIVIRMDNGDIKRYPNGYEVIACSLTHGPELEIIQLPIRELHRHMKRYPDEGPCLIPPPEGEPWDERTSIQSIEPESRPRKKTKPTVVVLIRLPSDVSGWYVPAGYAGKARIVTRNGDSVDVRWLDGPGRNKVEPIDEEYITECP